MRQSGSLLRSLWFLLLLGAASVVLLFHLQEPIQQPHPGESPPNPPSRTRLSLAEEALGALAFQVSVLSHLGGLWY